MTTEDGGLKKAVNAGSRLTAGNVFAGKAGAIASVSPAPVGGVSATHALRQTFVSLNPEVMQGRQAYTRGVPAMPGEDGSVSDADAGWILDYFVAAFAKWAARCWRGRH